MSGFITMSGEDYLLGVLCGQNQIKEAFYLALIVEREPTKFSGGFDLDEPTIPSYARAEYRNEPFTWDVAGGELRSRVPVEFAVADVEWPSIRHWAICSDRQGGEVLWAGSYESSLEVPLGGQLVIPAGGVVIRAANNTLRVNL